MKNMGFLKTGTKAMKFFTNSLNPLKSLGINPQRPWETFGDWGKSQRKQGKKVMKTAKKLGKGILYGINELDGVRVNLHNGKVLGAAKHAKNIFTKNDDSWFRKATEPEGSVPNYALNHPIMNDASVKSNHFGGGDDFNGINPLQTGVVLISHTEKLFGSGTFEDSIWGESMNSFYRGITRKLGRNPGYTFSEFMLAMDKIFDIYAGYTTLLRNAAVAEISDNRNPRMVEAVMAVCVDVDNDTRAATIRFLQQMKNFIADSVRLPKSLSLYVNWRYGHLYKINKCRTTGYVMYSGSEFSVANLTSIKSALQSDATYNQVMSDLVEIYPQPNKLDWDPESRYDIKEVQMRDNLTELRLASGVQRIVLKEGLTHGEAMRAAVLACAIADDGSSVTAPFHVSSALAYYIGTNDAVASFDPTDTINYTSTTTVATIEANLREIALMISSGYSGFEIVMANSTTAKVLPLSVPAGDHVYLSVQQVQDIQRDAIAALLDVA